MTIDITLRHGTANIPIGTIEEVEEGETVFTFSRSYIELGPDRPLLSLRWFDVKGEEKTLGRMFKRGDKIGRRGVLPAWFSGLLPEGALRKLVDRELGPGRHSETLVLSRLGGDLPGAVAASGGGRMHRHEYPEPDRRARRIQYSLAGVQMKFGAKLDKDRVTFPALGLGGDYIAKTTSETLPILVEAEYVGMQLSSLVGVDTAPTSLVPREQVDGVPEEFLRHGEYVFLSRRFDRIGSTRVHIEDFAQIADALGDQKYFFGNYESCLNTISRFSASRDADIGQGFRRMVNDILIGNADAHLKNWSFVHGEGGPRLSPAYDIVPSGAWGDTDLGIKLAGRKSMEAIGLATLQRIGRFLEVPEEEIRRLVSETIDMAYDAWPRADLGTETQDRVRKALVARLDRLQLVREFRPTASMSRAQPVVDDTDARARASTDAGTEDDPRSDEGPEPGPKFP